MSEKVEKERLNIYVGKDLLKRLKYCSERYGVSHTQLAVMLIGQGVAGIEKSFNIFDDMSKDLVKHLNDEDENNK
jgi:hypothetical protein